MGALHHPIVVGAPRDISAAARPLLLQRSDDNVVAATLDDLRSVSGRRTLAGLQAAARDAQGRLKLFQPIQRQFHLALIEAWCDVPGTPRIDPARVESAGLVLRRLGSDGRRQGWMRSQGRVRGWVPLARVGGELADPLAEQRLASGATGVAGIDRALREQALTLPDNLLDEDMVPLYVAPPDVCSDAGRTVYYGVVPTTSSEFAPGALAMNDADSGVDFGPDSTLFRSHLVEGLQGLAMYMPLAGQWLRAGWFDALEASGTDLPSGVSQDQADALRDPGSADHRRMVRLVLLLRQLAVEFNAFDENDTASADIRTLLREVQMPLVWREGDAAQRSVEAWTFLSQANTVLLEKGSLDHEVEMPERWPGLDSTGTGRLARALERALQARFAATQPREGRFAPPDARYQLRAFLRLKPEGACPARVVWSGYSEPFVIAPWYEGASGAAPVQVALPDPFDRDALKALKPNVAFTVPPGMHNLLMGSAKDLMEGKGDKGTLGITWICSFSIPIITICAFIALNVLLSLFNIFFGWMAFFKICIPFPKFGNKPPGG